MKNYVFDWKSLSEETEVSEVVHLVYMAAEQIFNQREKLEVSLQSYLLLCSNQMSGICQYFDCVHFSGASRTFSSRAILC